jgi:Ca2+-binding RTX toxin-like protein
LVGLRITVLLVASVLLAVLLACGVALGENITCEPSARENPCLGTQEDDTLRGIANADDFIKGLGGIDTIYGGGFRDNIEGGRGNDTLRGEGGADTLYGDEEQESFDLPYRSNDRLLGGPGNDTLRGGPGNDRVVGGPGNDRINGGIFYGSSMNHGGRDYVHGNDGDDYISSFAESELYGDAGEDDLQSHRGDALLNGGPGNDSLYAGTCTENTTAEAIGGPGEDYFTLLSRCAETSTPVVTVTYLAVDGEHDRISCYPDVNGIERYETVRADPMDTYPDPDPDFPGPAMGRQYCDSLTIVE